MMRSRISGNSRIAVLSLAAVLALAFTLFVSPLPVAAATISVNPGSLTNHECNATEWHFVINGLADASDAPTSIHVTWANGDSQDLPLDNFTGGVAHYFSFDNLDSTVVSATAEINASYNNFNLSHGPCPVTPTPTVEIPTETPTQEIPTETPPVEVTETVAVTETVGGEEETPVSTNTPAAGVTETVGGEEETPVPTEAPVEELPSTGAAPGDNGTSSLLAAALLAVILAGTGLALRRRSVGGGR